MKSREVNVQKLKQLCEMSGMINSRLHHTTLKTKLETISNNILLEPKTIENWSGEIPIITNDMCR